VAAHRVAILDIPVSMSHQILLNSGWKATDFVNER